MVVLEVNHKQMELFIERNYENQLSLFVWGTTGIGKSETIETKARDIAEKEKRVYVCWNKISKEEKHEVAKNPEKYFFLMDIRLSQMDPSDLKGLPSLNGSDSVEWKVPFWLKVASLKGAMGFVFFDEINLAPPTIQASAYQLILDRALGEVTINDGVGVLAAGNRISDKANVYELPKPLQNRFNHITLKVPNVEDWTIWAIKAGVDSRIITFLNAHPPRLMGKLDSNSKEMAFPTPRSWGKSCSRLISGIQNLKDVESLASSAVGMGAAMEFASFLKFQRKIDLQELLKNPKKYLSSIEDEDLDLKYSMISLVTDWYDKNYKKEDLNKVLEISKYVQAEFAVLLLRFCKLRHQSSFKKNAPTLKSWNEIWQKYGKYFDI